MSDTTDATETEAQDNPTAAGPFTSNEPVRLPDDHPLVKTLAAQKAEIKELKPKASSYDELVQARESDAEKAEADSASVPAKVADALRGHLVAFHGIDAERADLFLTATDPEVLLKQVTALVGESDKRKKNHVPREGNPTPTTGEDDERELVRNLFG